MRTAKSAGAVENIRRFEGETDALWLGEVTDGSMEPSYPQGSIVGFSYGKLARDGDCCLVSFKGGGLAFRKVESGGGAYRLSALNGDCPVEIHPVGDVEFILPASGVLLTA